MATNEPISIDRKRAALIIQDMQNDVMIEGGAFADSGAPQHAKEQNVVENCKRLAAACRKAGIPVIHVWYIVEEGAPGLKLNAPLFEGVKSTNALVRGSWGAEPAEGLERQNGDYVVEKMRMSGWQDTNLETLLRGLERDQIIVTGAWTNMSIEHVARTGADKGYFMFVPEDCCSTMNADWHNASINYALQNVSTVTSCDGARARTSAAVRGREDAGSALPWCRPAARGARDRPARATPGRGARARRRRRDLRHRSARRQGRLGPAEADGARPRGSRCRRSGRRRGAGTGSRRCGRTLVGAFVRPLRRLPSRPTRSVHRASARDRRRHPPRRHDRDGSRRRDRVPRDGDRSTRAST